MVGPLVNIAEAAAAAQRVAAAYKAARQSGQSEEEAAASSAASEPSRGPVGFVIPKNKISVPGQSLAIVPVGGSSTKLGEAEDEKPKRPRKCRWGPDLIMGDPIAKRGRLLALQVSEAGRRCGV